ncbi:hypothetical protein [Pseudaestuariivita atlantica]|uniref:hypothetical protein n=1 Tax=Pseudaestuariivita atlantica TaxID=1317121 RepID=UPI00106D8446|nr:hypothetical protein [Pseudaestuariivita atlantica]
MSKIAASDAALPGIWAAILTSAAGAGGCRTGRGISPDPDRCHGKTWDGDGTARVFRVFLRNFWKSLSLSVVEMHQNRQISEISGNSWDKSLGVAMALHIDVMAPKRTI